MILQGLYALCVVLISAFLTGYAVILVAFWLKGRKHFPTPALTATPHVLIQLPVYN